MSASVLPACVGLGVDDVARLIPHRPPFLFVRSAEVEDAGTVRGVACWEASHPILAGHFPQWPIVPGVCQIEAMAQLAGVLVAFNEQGASSVSEAGRIGVLGAVRRAAFKGPVGPDQALDMACKVRKLGDAGFLVSGNAWVQGSLVLNVEFLIAVRPVDALAPESQGQRQPWKP